MIYDPAQLDTELHAAGLNIHGCASSGRIDWIDPPTPQEKATAQTVLAAHDPAARTRRMDALRQERAALRATQGAMLPSTIEGWNALSPEQRSAAIWRGLRIQWLEGQGISRP